MSNDLFENTPHPGLHFRLALELLVDVSDKRDLGWGPLGQRFIVPITGGVFRGGPGFETLKGMVLPGGADRQLVRPDGIKELDALYELRTEDGDELTVRNRVLIDESRAGQRYALSRVSLSAPSVPWGYLNSRLFLGTLQSARPTRNAVIVRCWEVDDREFHLRGSGS
ncbi:DUF3237 domain-containing protein [Paracoccus aurantiacus]|uniref:DUF3237 domain-containing protein n=1 Tax=Paracoccus aurantiacus TaxID=2599412 RepID=A0A5C6RZ96_9RHOB|nr:DUF3237 family protein [Paracoccus aurantiacus]TXB67483.1 DUF3237 domain-containing protein [Paracoccus aurantiacus]